MTDKQTNCWVGGYWKVDPIPIEDNLFKEVVTRLITNLTSNKEFYTDSNCCDFLKWVKIWLLLFPAHKIICCWKTFTWCFSVQVLDCFGWFQDWKSDATSCYPSYLNLRNFWGLGVDLLGLVCKCKIEGQTGTRQSKSLLLATAIQCTHSSQPTFYGFRVQDFGGWGLRV